MKEGRRVAKKTQEYLISYQPLYSLSISPFALLLKMFDASDRGIRRRTDWEALGLDTHFSRRNTYSIFLDIYRETSNQPFFKDSAGEDPLRLISVRAAFKSALRNRQAEFPVPVPLIDPDKAAGHLFRIFYAYREQLAEDNEARGQEGLENPSARAEAESVDQQASMRFDSPLDPMDEEMGHLLAQELEREREGAQPGPEGNQPPQAQNQPSQAQTPSQGQQITPEERLKAVKAAQATTATRQELEKLSALDVLRAPDLRDLLSSVMGLTADAAQTIQAAQLARLPLSTLIMQAAQTAMTIERVAVIPAQAQGPSGQHTIQVAQNAQRLLATLVLQSRQVIQTAQATQVALRGLLAEVDRTSQATSTAPAPAPAAPTASTAPTPPGLRTTQGQPATSTPVQTVDPLDLLIVRPSIETDSQEEQGDDDIMMMLEDDSKGASAGEKKRSPNGEDSEWEPSKRQRSRR